ncbi:hypothetical protein BGZ98_009098 [Dissophora globulifera]|nr:hypothetical protein BGZ98_009098 [Dissophora globulifera]
MTKHDQELSASAAAINASEGVDNTISENDLNTPEHVNDTDDHEDFDPDHGTRTVETNDNLVNKRSRVYKPVLSGAAAIATSAELMKALVDKQLQDQREQRSNLRERELAVEQREKEFLANILKIESERREADRKQLAEEKEELKKEILQYKQEIKTMKEALDSKVTQCFEMFAENQLLKKELEWRQKH